MKPLRETDAIVALQMQFDALARRNRVLWVALAGTLVVGLVAGANTSAPEPKILKAHGIQLVDNAGQVRAELAIDKDGSAGSFYP